MQARGMRLRKPGWARLQATGGAAVQPPVDLSDGGSRSVGRGQDDPEEHQELHLRGTIWLLGVHEVTNDYEEDRCKAQRVDAGSGGARTERRQRAGTGSSKGKRLVRWLVGEPGATTYQSAPVY